MSPTFTDIGIQFWILTTLWEFFLHTSCFLCFKWQTWDVM